MVLVCLLGPLPDILMADEVRLNNGDRITGRILDLEDEKLNIETDYADTVSIDWEDVKSLRADKPLSLKFRDGVAIPYDKGVFDGDRLIVHELEFDSRVKYDDIKMLNPAELFISGQVSLGGNSTSGNTNTNAVNFSTDWTVRRNRHRGAIGARFNRGEADGQLTAENLSGNLQYGYTFHGSWLALFIQNLEQDTFQNLDLRSSSTLGLGYEVFDSHNHNLIIAIGPTGVYQKFGDQPATVTPSGTWYLNWQYQLFKDNLTLYHYHQGSRDFGHQFATRINAYQGIRIKMYKDLKFNLEYSYRFNSQPSGGRKSDDTGIVFGLTYEIKR